MSEDQLYNLVNNYFIGNYQAAINEADSIPESEMKSEYVYRCYCNMGNYQLVQEEISSDSAPSLQAIKYLSQYLEDRTLVQSMQEKLSQLQQTEQSVISSAIISFSENQFDEGLRILSNFKTMSCQALMITGLLLLHRVDKAEEIYRRMQQQDEDHTLTGLAGTWITIAKGGAGLKDAFYQFQELIDKFSASPLLLNGLAVYNLKSGNFEEAQSALQESLEKNPTHPDTIANLISCSSFSDKSASLISQSTTRQIRQLNANDPDHVWLKRYESFNSTFDNCAAKFSASK